VVAVSAVRADVAHAARVSRASPENIRVTTSPRLRRLAVRALAKRLSLDRKPICIGPWRSEVGFEGLYWVPFLLALAARVPDFWSRAVVVSRGGGSALYGRWSKPEPNVNADEGPTEFWQPVKAVDLYTLRSVTEVRRENLKDWSDTKLQKQTRVMPWDRTVLAEAAKVAGIDGSYHTIHPSWMYWALEPFWDERMGLRDLLKLTDYQPLHKPPPPVTIDALPAQYVAVKFYGRATWPHPHPETTAFVADVVGRIAQQIPVVLLNSGHDGDEHIDMQITGPNIHTLPALPPEVNLGVQLALIGRAQAFVGTYGGLAQVALRMGIPSLSVYGVFGGTAHAHLSLSSWLSKAMNVPFAVGGLAECGLWRQTLATVGPVQPLGAVLPSTVPAREAVAV
jgi:hypothetical protein